jgi:hypothetical protein
MKEYCEKIKLSEPQLELCGLYLNPCLLYGR